MMKMNSETTTIVQGLAIVPDRNHRGRDQSGAFLPGAKAWQRAWGGEVVKIDISRTLQHQFDATCEAIEDFDRRHPLPTPELVAQGIAYRRPVAIFCHGFANRLQIGPHINIPRRWDRFPRALRALGSDVRVGLFACSTGSGIDDRFADRLRDSLCELGARDCVVLAHSTAGHAYLNSHKKRFAGDGSPTGGHGGQWWVAPDSKLWPAWRRLVPSIWPRLMDLTPVQVHEVLAGRLSVDWRSSLVPV